MTLILLEYCNYLSGLGNYKILSEFSSADKCNDEIAMFKGYAPEDIADPIIDNKYTASQECKSI